MFNFFKNIFQTSAPEDKPVSKPDIDSIIQKVQQVEENSDIEPGRKIHEFDHGFLSLRLDRDITKNYRITVFQGTERIYSFSISEDSVLENALHQILDFLNGSRSFKELPNSETLKGFYFGHPKD
ncbi:hypothetical protein [Gracilimonas tropica]|uniref:hypothetical protein n=1 Tax=Gracilimonas tropica TaxID=454600 RepID=UPI00036A4526|nr:hypothetical protein [Gracilimonas tropica]